MIRAQDVEIVDNTKGLKSVGADCANTHIVIGSVPTPVVPEEA